jgi:hypothetical protein
MADPLRHPKNRPETQAMARSLPDFRSTSLRTDSPFRFAPVGMTMRMRPTQMPPYSDHTRPPLVAPAGDAASAGVRL